MIMNRKLLRFTASWCQPCKMLAIKDAMAQPPVPIILKDPTKE
jgi:thiol-disulfide isomerase/thioredoxin